MINYLRTETFENNWTLEIYQDDQKPYYSCLTCIVKRNGVIVDDNPYLFQTGTLVDVGFGSIDELIRVVTHEAIFDGQ